MSDPVEVLDYWIGAVGPAGWYAGGADLDAEIRAMFGELWEAARDGGLDHWVDGTPGTLAYLVVTDQMARNMHRGKAEAFATDPKALAAARKAVAEGWDMAAPEPERQFFYMPFEHSEDPIDQAQSVALIGQRLADPEALLHAQVHQDIIRRFGRFPFRNQALGRDSTVEEREFMENGGYGAMVQAVRASHAKPA